jgi:hypothetical protein
MSQNRGAKMVMNMGVMSLFYSMQANDSGSLQIALAYVPVGYISRVINIFQHLIQRFVYLQ